jgi:hypothetical protein
LFVCLLVLVLLTETSWPLANFIMSNEVKPSWPWSYGSWIYHYLCKRSITTDAVSSNPTQSRCTTLCNQVFQWHETGRWFSPCPPVSSTSKTEILLKMALSTITLTLVNFCFFHDFVNRSY